MSLSARSTSIVKSRRANLRKRSAFAHHRGCLRTRTHLAECTRGEPSKVRSSQAQRVLVGGANEVARGYPSRNREERGQGRYLAVVGSSRERWRGDNA